jgi:hypothetical protein
MLRAEDQSDLVSIVRHLWITLIHTVQQRLCAKWQVRREGLYLISALDIKFVRQERRS